jgi:septum site-determining protein MinC
MENKGFVEDGFIVDLGNAKDAAEIIYELGSILDIPEAKNKKICLKLGEIDLSQSQLLSIKSLITSTDSELAFIDTNSQQTELAALNLGIIVSELLNKIEVEEVEAEDAEIKKTEAGEPKDGLSYELIQHEEIEDEKVEVVEKTEDELKAEEKLEELIDEENDYLSEKEAALYEISKFPTLYLQQTLRSGQTMSYDGNIVLIGDANPGSELIAKGDITVWGILGGIAHAGARGNDCGKIRALKINAIQLRISGYYARRPDAINIPFIQRTTEFTPEEARVNKNKEIAIYKMSEM